jgi:SAM-dependent methyltransferase
MSPLGPGAWGLNVGCGLSRLHEHLLNVDIHITPSVDCVADAQHLPFKDQAFKVIVTQETLEHVPNPFRAASEMARVLQKGGLLYCQVPFVIGYHSPPDFWRFTRDGIQQLVAQAGLRPETVSMSDGPGTGFYRIIVEFIASAVGRVAPPLYESAKVLCALVLFPLRWLDVPLWGGSQADRVAAGYFVIARRA